MCGAQRIEVCDARGRSSPNPSPNPNPNPSPDPNPNQALSKELTFVTLDAVRTLCLFEPSIP